MKTYVVCKVFNEIENVWNIKSVETIERYESIGFTTKAKLLQRIDEANNNKRHWSLIDVEDNISEILDFMIGERQYKRLKEIDEIYQDFESGIEEVRSVGEDIPAKYEYAANFQDYYAKEGEIETYEDRLLHKTSIQQSNDWLEKQNFDGFVNYAELWRLGYEHAMKELNNK